MAMNEKQMLVHYESQIEVLQMKLDELFKSGIEKDVVTLNYKKSAEQYTKTIDGLTMKLQEFEGAQENQVAAVESRNDRIAELETHLVDKDHRINQLEEELRIAQDNITNALKQYDEQHQGDVTRVREEKDAEIASLNEQLAASKGDNNVEIQNLRKSAKDFEISNRNNLNALSQANVEISALKEELTNVRETEVQASRIASQLTQLKDEHTIKIHDLADEIERLNKELEEAQKPKPVAKAPAKSPATKPKTTTRRKTAASK